MEYDYIKEGSNGVRYGYIRKERTNYEIYDWCKRNPITDTKGNSIRNPHQYWCRLDNEIYLVEKVNDRT